MRDDEYDDPPRRSTRRRDDEYDDDEPAPRLRRPDWPLMVQVGLWGLPNRLAAWAFVWLSLAFAAAGVAAGILIHPIGFAAVLMVFAALWYYLSIRWVDENGRWQ